MHPPPTPARACTLLQAWAGLQGTMAWALQELTLHQQAEQQGVPWAALN